MKIETLTFEEVKGLYLSCRHEIVEMLDLALEHGDITPKERDVVYRRIIDWQSLEEVGKVIGVTRERIRQIEAKVFEKMKLLTMTPIPELLSTEK